MPLSCDLDLVTPKSWTFHQLAPSTSCDNLQQNQFIRFQTTLRQFHCLD